MLLCSTSKPVLYLLLIAASKAPSAWQQKTKSSTVNCTALIGDGFLQQRSQIHGVSAAWKNQHEDFQAWPWCCLLWYLFMASQSFQKNYVLILGDVYNKMDQETVNEIVLKALKSGINFIDTAPWYGQGLSEERLGIALKTVPRDKYYIATKVFQFYNPICLSKSD